MSKKHRLHILRHSESYKNLNDIHGGGGESLTPNGIKTTKKRSSFLKNICNEAIIYCNQSKQVVETSQIISKSLNIPLTIEPQLNGIDLGSLAGISNSDAKEKFSKDFSKMEKWRNGEITISEINFENGENFIDFYQRIHNFLSKSLTLTQDIIIVCTTSVYIMIINILTMKEKFELNSYRNISVPLGAYSCFLQSNSSIELIVYNHIHESV